MGATKCIARRQRRARSGCLALSRPCAQWSTTLGSSHAHFLPFLEITRSKTGFGANFNQVFAFHIVGERKQASKRSYGFKQFFLSFVCGFKRIKIIH